jgi:acetolactate synthase-1/2/3 large subunit
MKLTGAKIILECLLEQNVDTIFGYPGGQIIPLYDALYDYTKDGRIQHVLTSHEQGATHAADGYARSTGKVGVCFATSGPGATNTVTGIATANIDSSPLVVITGQVPVASIGRDAFQEVDIVGVTLPVVKHSFACRTVEEIAGTIRLAFRIAMSGRPGPVLVDVPKDLMVMKTNYVREEAVVKDPTPPTEMERIRKLADYINKAERPVIYAGGGVSISDASAELTELAEKNQIPVTTTLMCLGNFSRRNPLSLGMAGMHGEKNANLAVHNCDLLLTIGARFSDRVTGNPETFAEHAKVVHIDIDRSEVGKNVGVDYKLIGDVKCILKELMPLIDANKREDWNGQVRSWKRDLPESGTFEHDLIFKVVNEKLGDDCIVATDVGQHQMWTAQKWPFTKPRKLITSGGLGTMGFGLGAAIGAKLANPHERVILFTGDGSFRMNCNELMTVAAQELPIIVFVFKNNTLGMVRQWQKLFFNKRYSSTDLPDVVDYTKLCSAFGLNGFEVDNEEDLRTAIDDAVASGKGAVIACDIYIDENVWPIVPPGDSINNQVTEE